VISSAPGKRLDWIFSQKIVDPFGHAPPPPILHCEVSKDHSSRDCSSDQPRKTAKLLRTETMLLSSWGKQAGTYEFKCARFCGFGHDRMKRKLVIDE
jgi:hypothetical protein